MRGSCAARAVGIAAVCSLCAQGWARDETVQPAVSPPRPVGGLTTPRYPAGARGPAAITVELAVGRDGLVHEGRAVTGREPFASAALDEAMDWRFEPATRAGQPIEVRIRVRVGFDDPSASRRPDAPPFPRQRSPPAPAGVAEVTVHGTRSPDPASVQMTGDEVRQLPGSFGDAFRAIEALPGVVPIVSGLPYFLVRGAPPGDTGFFIDGVHVPALFHLGVGAAVVHPALIDRVDLYPGAYPARFGRFTGGILTGEVNAAPETRAEASLRLIDVGGLASTEFDQGRGDVLVSGRYGYPGPILSLLAPSVSLAYWDYQARLRWRPTPRDELAVFAFGSLNRLADTAIGFDLGIQFHRVDLRWTHPTSRTGELRANESVNVKAIEALLRVITATRRYSARMWFRRRWTDLAGDTVGLLDMSQVRCVAFCGLGNPQSFWRSLDQLGVAPVEKFEYGDHHRSRRPKCGGWRGMRGTWGWKRW